MNTQPHIDNSLPHCERLRRHGAVSDLFAEGSSGFCYPLRYVWRESESEEAGDVMVLFTVPKRFHKRANKRNLLRRRVKEAYRLQRSLIPRSDSNRQFMPLTIALIYSSKEILDYERISKAVAKAMQLIAVESGRSGRSDQSGQNDRDSKVVEG